MATKNGTGNYRWQERFGERLSRDLDGWAARMYAKANGIPLDTVREEIRRGGNNVNPHHQTAGAGQ